MRETLEKEVADLVAAHRADSATFANIGPIAWPGGHRIAVNFTADFDAMLLRRLHNEPSMQLAKGEFGGRVGIWRLIELFPADTGRANLFSYYVNGMNFTPSTPSYEDMRDGILAAVAAGSAPGDRCKIWTAFAQFGIGVGSSGVVNPDGVTVTITPSFTRPSGC